MKLLLMSSISILYDGSPIISEGAINRGCNEDLKLTCTYKKKKRDLYMREYLQNIEKEYIVALHYIGNINSGIF